jgi:hypothetical protein
MSEEEKRYIRLAKDGISKTKCAKLSTDPTSRYFHARDAYDNFWLIHENIDKMPEEILSELFGAFEDLIGLVDNRTIEYNVEQFMLRPLCLHRIKEI